MVAIFPRRGSNRFARAGHQLTNKQNDGKGMNRDHPDVENRALLQRVSRGDREAFRALYYALYPPLSRHLYRLIRRIDDVEELLNDVMWVVWQKAGEFRGEAQVSTWVLGIATLKSHRWWHRRRRQQEQVEWHDDMAVTETLGIDMPSVEPAATVMDDRSLAQGLAQLSNEHRETVELAYYFGYSCEEIAQLMECPVGTVKTRLHYARKRLRQLLSPVPTPCGDTP
jgi:RNA polymerase sigma-70 factor (ECF subfamily)